MGPWTKTLTAAAAAGAAGLAWARVEAELFTLREYTVPILPAGTPDVRLLHLSDLHLTPSQHRKIAWVRSLAELEPDVVIDTGDNMAHVDVLPSLLHALEPLLAFPGAFVMGSNDYTAPTLRNPARYLLRDSSTDAPPRREAVQLPAADLSRHLQDAGWKDLTNRRDELQAGGVRVSLVGVDDPHLDRDAFPSASGEDHGTVHLGVTHAPYRRVLDEMYADGADLLLAGHTHGGQLCVPGLGALVTNCDIDRARASGLHGWPGVRPDEFGGQDSTWLHVCAGLGTSPYTPVRFACRPEASLLTLTSR
ncbi:MAG: metallophosphoesterase [Cellulomonadaceae bacterium]